MPSVLDIKQATRDTINEPPVRITPFSSSASASASPSRNRLNYLRHNNDPLLKNDFTLSRPNASTDIGHFDNDVLDTTSLSSNNSMHSQKTSQSSNYQLTKMSTEATIDSNDFDLQQRYKIKLSLNRKEIDLITYTWNQMLVDKPLNHANLPHSQEMPGAFKSHKIIQTSSTVASSLFCRQLYSNILIMDPDLEKLFPSIHHQAAAFAGVLSLTVSQLENLQNIDDYLCKLGKRHSRILGIEPFQFELFGEALIVTFHERFGLKFTPELEVLWIKLYMYLANSILQFGIDPMAKLNGEFPQYEESIPESTKATSSVSDLATDNTSFADYSALDFGKRESVSTHLTSVDSAAAVPQKKHNRYRAKIKQKRKDCVIM